MTPLEATAAAEKKYPLPEEVNSSESNDLFDATVQWRIAYAQGLLDGQPKWIDVKERLPKIVNDLVQCVLVYYDVDEYNVGFYNDLNNCWVDDNNIQLHNVTHWMPLPTAPSKAKEEGK